MSRKTLFDILQNAPTGTFIGRRVWISPTAMTVNDWLKYEITLEEAAEYENARTAYQIQQTPLFKALK